MKSLMIFILFIPLLGHSVLFLELGYNDIYGNLKSVVYDGGGVILEKSQAELHNQQFGEELSFEMYDGTQYTTGDWYTGQFLDLTYGEFSGLLITEEIGIQSDFSNSNLENGSYEYDLLEFIKFDGANLQHFNFNSRETSILNTSFKDADLRFSNMINITQNIEFAIWEGANLYGATLPSGYDQAWFESEGAIFAVPEPSTYALILGGLVLGFVAYRRK